MNVAINAVKTQSIRLPIPFPIRLVSSKFWLETLQKVALFLSFGLECAMFVLAVNSKQKAYSSSNHPPTPRKLRSSSPFKFAVEKLFRELSPLGEFSLNLMSLELTRRVE